MSALLKIVQGPNAGAEIALPDGIEITLGKADTCDIVLADPTLPDAPMTLSATSGGVTLDGSPLEPFHVVLHGSTALAVGPADAAWQELVWPKPKVEESAPAPEKAAELSATPVTPSPSPVPATEPKPKKRSWIRRLVILLVLLVVLLLGFLYLAAALRSAHRTREREKAVEAERAAHDQTLAALADRYHLSVGKTESRRPSFTGNFATRAERLAATAELYSAIPGVTLDLTDDETLRTAVADSLFTSGETGLTVTSVTGRSAVLGGTAASPDALSAALDALRADVPRLDAIDTDAVTFRSPGTPAVLPAADPDATAARRRRNARAADASNPNLPVCGILSTPYPCLVLQNGTRVFPGAAFGNSVVQSIGPDSVVLATTNGTFTWKP